MKFELHGRQYSHYAAVLLFVGALAISMIYILSEPHKHRTMPLDLLADYELDPVAATNVSSSGSSGFEWREAVWRNHVGEWLVRCHEAASAVPILETFYSRPCQNDCSGHGVCNHDHGVCYCSLGYAGVQCDEELVHECNNPTVEGYPYGHWRVSICPAYCDKRRAVCFCGSNSKYPHRPVPESCGFMEDEKDWTSKPAESVIYANESEKIGWCNVNPEDFYSGKAQIKRSCDCRYDCTAGPLCEFPTECVCVNQCSKHGVCKNGLCQCNEGWFGIDCSIPSSLENLDSLPSWLHQAKQLKAGENSMSQVLVERRRPLIYVYDLPFESNVHLLEGRHTRWECVNRAYGQGNMTEWSANPYAVEMSILESLLSSSHRTTNGDEADYFYVPVFGACAITRADDAPHFDMEKELRLRSFFSGNFYKRAYFHIRSAYPFWNRSGGRDHIWYFPWDEGSCIAPKEIWNSTMLTHWGNTNVKHKKSTTAYWPDSWNEIPVEWRGNHPCYDPEKDIVIPTWKHPDYMLRAEELRTRPLQDRHTFFFFNGNLGNNFDPGRPEDSYSMGIRQKLAAEFASSPNKQGKLGRQAAPDVIFTHKRDEEYGLSLSKARFCGVFPGDGWSPRMEDSIYHGCIPVVIQDGIHATFENSLKHEDFTVRIAEEDIPRMLDILRNLTAAEVEARFEVVQKLWQRFINRDSILLEAQRQALWNHNEMWAMRYKNMTGDDAFSTLIQILSYKLHNDAWRKEQDNGAKQWGLPSSCHTGSSL